MPRYIDAEKIEYDKHKRIGLGIDYGLNESDTYYTTTKEKIDAIPTADVVEQKRGKWIDTGSGEECSICREIQYGYDNFRHYCPNCGAVMEQ